MNDDPFSVSIDEFDGFRFWEMEDIPIPNNVNLGTAKYIGQGDVEQLLKILNKKAVKKMLPMQAGDVLETFADTSKLEKYCGYKPFTPLDEGLQKFVSWYLKMYS